MCGRYSLTKFANFLIIVLRAEEIVITFGSKMVTISARNTIMRKFANFVRLYLANFVRLYFQHNTTFFNFFKFWNFATFKRFFPGMSRSYCLDQKLVYNGNCPLHVVATT